MGTVGNIFSIIRTEKGDISENPIDSERLEECYEQLNKNAFDKEM